jgi:hypothetical protein
MNTTGIQNYLSNVFRPFVLYDTGTSNFTPKLEMSNIDTYSGNVVSVIRGDIGDSNSNVYVGLLSGNPIVDARACVGVSAFGYSAGSNISNCSNSVYLGTEAGATSSNNQGVISIGYQAGKGGNGVSNIFIGTGTRSTAGSSNIFLGHGIDLSSVSNQLRIGFGTSIPIAANLSTKWVGLNGLVTPLDVGNTFDASGNVRIQGQLGINITPGGRTLDVNGNFRTADASANVLDFSNGLTRSSGGFASIQSNVPVPGIPNDVIIGPIKKGIIHISVLDQASSANRAASIYFAYTTSNVTPISEVSNGTASINISNGDLKLDTTNVSPSTYDYSITYFPLP